MLKGLNPVLSPDLLYALAAMGHGDEIAIVDRNFPATSTARRLVTASGVDVTTAMEAVLSVLPLDTFVPSPLARMEVVGHPQRLLPVHQEVQQACERHEGRPVQMASVPREEFYERARRCFAVVATSEERPYACFLLTKGVIGEAGMGPGEPVNSTMGKERGS
jgi:L-fucose mutarotase